MDLGCSNLCENLHNQQGTTHFGHVMPCPLRVVRNFVHRSYHHIPSRRFCWFCWAENNQDLCAGILHSLGHEGTQSTSQAGSPVLIHADPRSFSAARALPSIQDRWHMPQDVWSQTLFWSLAGDAGKLWTAYLHAMIPVQFLHELFPLH